MPGGVPSAPLLIQQPSEPEKAVEDGSNVLAAATYIGDWLLAPAMASDGHHGHFGSQSATKGLAVSFSHLSHVFI